MRLVPKLVVLVGLLLGGCAAIPLIASGGAGITIGTIIESIRDADQALATLKPINVRICIDILGDKELIGKPRAVIQAWCDHLPSHVIEMPIQLHYVIEAVKNG